jgi:hypothetical protein
MHRLGFRVASHETNHVSFVRGQVELSLWYNTAFPFQNPSERLIQELKDCSSLIVCGHNPHAQILDWIPSKINVITNEITRQEGEPHELNLNDPRIAKVQCIYGKRRNLWHSQLL